MELKNRKEVRRCDNRRIKKILKYLKDERKLGDRSINYYNSVIRFIYEATLDKVFNKKGVV